jgi:hypothetical protein
MQIAEQIQRSLGERLDELPDKLLSPFYDNEVSSIYICCFSSKADNLRQWLPYANDGHGAAVGFKSIDEHHYITAHEDIRSVNACYSDDKDKQAFLEEFLRSSFDLLPTSSWTQSPDTFCRLRPDYFGPMLRSLYDALISCKSKDYEDESEWRLFITKTHSEQRSNGFYIKNNIMKPFCDFELQPDAITSITLGPRCEHELNSHSFALLAKQSLGTAPEIRTSTVQYRG